MNQKDFEKFLNEYKRLLRTKKEIIVIANMKQKEKKRKRKQVKVCRKFYLLF